MLPEQVRKTTAQLSIACAFLGGLAGCSDSLPQAGNGNNPAWVAQADRAGLAKYQADLVDQEGQYGKPCFTLLGELAYNGGELDSQVFDSSDPERDLAADDALDNSSQPCGKNPERVEKELSWYRHIIESIMLARIEMKKGFKIK